MKMEMESTDPQAPVGVLLAAGVGRRFGGDKLLHPLPDGRPIAVAAAASLRLACEQVVAVIRPNHAALAEQLVATGCQVTICPEASGGMGHSLAAGVRASANAAGWVVALADMPFITAESHRAVAACLQAGASLAATEYAGQRGHPVGFSRAWRAQLLAISGDQGGRAILNNHQADLVTCVVDDPGVVWDIDRPRDLHAPQRFD